MGRRLARNGRNGGGLPAAPGTDGQLAGLIGRSRIDRGPGVPIWRQIEQVLREAIAERRFMPGERLPTEAEFSQHFRVHRHTFRRAIAPLVADGLVTVRQGQGMTVREEVVAYPIGERTRFSEIVSAQHLSPSNRLIEIAEEAASPTVATALAVPIGSLVIRVEMLRCSDGVPMSLSTDYLPADRFVGLEEALRETPSMTAALAACGVTDYRRLRSTLHARAATADELEVLRQAPGTPILCADSVNVDADRRPVTFTRARFSAPRVQVVVEP